MTDTQTPEPTPAVERGARVLDPDAFALRSPANRRLFVPRAVARAQKILAAALDVEEMTQMIVQAEYAWASRSALHGVDPTKHPSLPSFVAAVQVAAILGGAA